MYVLVGARFVLALATRFLPASHNVTYYVRTTEIRLDPLPLPVLTFLTTRLSSLDGSNPSRPPSRRTTRTTGSWCRLEISSSVPRGTVRTPTCAAGPGGYQGW